MATTYNAVDDEVKIKNVTDRTSGKKGTNNSNTNHNDNNIRERYDDDVEKVPLPGAPPDGGWGWVVVVASFFISVLVDGVCFSFGIFFDEFRHEFGTSKATTSWIGSVLNGSYLTFGPIISALVNLYGCRKMTLFGAVLAFISFLLSTFSPNIGVLIFTYGFLGGLGFGFMYLPAIVMVGYYFEKRRALATGIACCGSGIGAFLFAPLTEHLLDQYGWRGANWILSALVLNGIICAIFYRPLAPTTITKSPAKLEVGVEAEESLKLLKPPPNQTDDGVLDTTDVRTYPRIEHEDDKSPIISDELRTQIYKSLNSDQNIVPRTRSMILHSPDASETARLAFSQDFFIHQRRRHDALRSDATHKIGVPPLQRQDIFYSGSIWHLKEYQEVGSVDEYRRKVMETAAQGESAAAPSKKSFIQSFFSVFDISLLRSPTFLIYGASCFLCMAGFFVPFMYMPTHAIDMGHDAISAALLISIIGITNTVGRVAVGFISDQPWADCLLINNLALICGGLATIFVTYYSHYYLLAIYSVVFGIAIAVFVSLRSIIMVELMGLEKLTTAFGFVIMCQGVSSFLGPPLAGAMSDSTGNYDAAFYLAGVALTLSGVICLPLRRIATWETKKKAQVSATGGPAAGRARELTYVLESDKS